MGLSGLDNQREQNSAGPFWHRLLVCLAICSLLIQSIVPELAMAARGAVSRQAIAVEAHQKSHAEHDVHGSTESKRNPAQDKPAHDRHELCPFCFVKTIQILPSVSGGALPPPPVFT